MFSDVSIDQEGGVIIRNNLGDTIYPVDGDADNIVVDEYSVDDEGLYSHLLIRLDEDTKYQKKLNEVYNRLTITASKYESV